jgi:hypothetical protein
MPRYRVSHDGMRTVRSDGCQNYSMGHCLLHSTYFPFAARHWFNLLIHSLPENRFQRINADFVPNLSDSRKGFIYRPELLCLEAVFEMPKEETRKCQRDLSPAGTVNVVQFAIHCHRKTLLSLLLYVALHCPHARASSFHLSPLHPEQRSR